MLLYNLIQCFKKIILLVINFYKFYIKIKHLKTQNIKKYKYFYKTYGWKNKIINRIGIN